MIQLRYTLSDSARRAELLAGRPHHAARTVELVPTPDLIAGVQFFADGTAAIDARRPSDEVLTPETGAALALRDAAERREIAAANARRAAEARAAEAEHEAAESAALAAWRARPWSERLERVRGLWRGIYPMPRGAQSEASAEADRRNAEAVRAYVLAEVPDYRRAAEDGRDVSHVGAAAARETVERDVEEAARAAGLDVVPSWDKYRRRDVPSALAYERRDALLAVVEVARAGWSRELQALLGEPASDIASVTVDDDGEPVTVAVVSIPVRGCDVDVAVRAESDAR